MAYEYQPTDKDMPNIVLLEKTINELKEEKDLSQLINLTKEEVVVPNTASTKSYTMIFLGTLVSLIGVRWVKKYE